MQVANVAAAEIYPASCVLNQVHPSYWLEGPGREMTALVNTSLRLRTCIKPRYMSSLQVDKRRADELCSMFASVKSRVAAAAKESNRKDDVRIVAVSKLKPAENIKALYDAGHRHFGENYVQELMEKAKVLPTGIMWHFIGSLQSNKCKALSSLPNLYAVETVDTKEKARKLSKARGDGAGGIGGKLRVYVQINTSGEESNRFMTPQSDT